MFLLQVLSLISLLSGGAQGASWTLDTRTTATVIVGVGAAHDSLAVAAASKNGIGAVNEHFDGQRWASTRLDGGMIMDSAISKAGVVVSTGMWQVFVSVDGGKNYGNVSIDGVSQNANIFGANEDKFGLVGTWLVKNEDPKLTKTVGGVAVSEDLGQSFKVVGGLDYPRYGAFPSETTWYVACGMWGSDAATLALDGHKKISSRFIVDPEKPSSVTFLNNLADVTAARKQQRKQTSDPTGWFGAVYKTTDAGATWTQAFQTNLETDYIYFNGISCSSDLNCVVVGEGDDGQGNYLTVAYTTNDGGATWALTHTTTSDVSLMMPSFVSDTEVWLAGSKLDGRKIDGQFYRSTDAGKTFELIQSLPDCFAVDMDFGVTVGFAACINSSGSASTVAVYK